MTQSNFALSLVLLPLAACGSSSSTDGGGSTAPPVSTTTSVGSWNFFREGVSCGGDEFEALSLNIVSLGGGALQVTLGEGAGAFVFAGTQTGSTLEVSGTATNQSGTELSIQSASWTISNDLNELVGDLSATRTSDGVACQLTDAIEAYRRDGTDSSIAAGAWTWTATTTSSTGGCNAVGTIERLETEFFAKRENAFIVEIETGSGDALQFDATFDGTVLTLAGTDTAAVLEASLLAGSEITLDASGGTGTGVLIVDNVEGGSSCGFELAIDAIRGRAGRDYIPFAGDVRATGDLLGIDPSSAETLRDFGVALGPSTSTPGTEQLGLDAVTEIIEAPIFDSATGEITGHRREALYFAVGDTVFRQDLAVRLDATGNPIDVAPTAVFTASRGVVTGIHSFTEFGDDDAVLAVDLLDSPDEWQALVVVDDAAQATSVELPATGEVIIDLLLDDAGQIRDALTFDAAQAELFLVSPDGTRQSLSSDVNGVAVSPLGLVAVARGQSLELFDAGTGQTSILDAGTNVTWTLSPFDGGTLFYARQSGFEVDLFRRDLDGTTTPLATETFSSSVNLAPTHLRATDDHLLVRFGGSPTLTRWISYSRGGGPGITLPDPNLFFQSGDVENERTSGNRFFYGTGTGLTLMLDATGANPPEFLDGGFIEGSIEEETYNITRARRSISLVIKGESGEVQLLNSAASPAVGFGDAAVIAVPSAMGRRLRAGAQPAGLVIADREAPTDPAPGSRLQFFHLGQAPSPITVLEVLGELALPIR